MIFDVDKAIADGASPTQIADFLAEKKKFDIESARKDGANDSQIISFLNKPAPKRTWGEAALDVPAGLMKTVGSLAQLPEQLTELVGGRPIDDLLPTRLGKQLESYGEKIKSPALKQKEEALGQDVQNQEGFFNEAKTAILGTLTDPALLTNFITEQVPNFLVSGGVGALAKGGVKLLLKDAAEQAVKKAGVGAAVGTEAIMQGVDSGSDAYERIYDELKKRGVPDVQAQTQALEKARAATIESAAATGLLAFIPGATKIEQALTRSATGPSKLTNKYARGFERFGGEPLSEGLQEYTGKLAANVAVQDVIPETDVFKGTGAAAGLGAMGGALFGLPAGMLNNRQISELEKLQQKAKETGQSQETILQIGFDPNVSNTQKIIMHPDGSTSFPSEKNNFYENPVSELSQEGLKEAYAPQQGDITPPPPAPKPVRDVEVQNPDVMYGGSMGVVGANPEAVQQEEYFKQQALEKEERLNNTLYPELLKSWGIKGKSIALQDVMDKDIRDPENATIVKAALLEQKKKTTNKTAKDNIDAYLKKPEFDTLQNKQDLLAPEGEGKFISVFAPGPNGYQSYKGKVVEDKEGNTKTVTYTDDSGQIQKVNSKSKNVVVAPTEADLKQKEIEHLEDTLKSIEEERDAAGGSDSKFTKDFKAWLKKNPLNTRQATEVGVIQRYKNGNPLPIREYQHKGYLSPSGLGSDELALAAYNAGFISEQEYASTKDIEGENTFLNMVGKVIEQPKEKLQAKTSIEDEVRFRQADEAANNLQDEIAARRSELEDIPTEEKIAEQELSKEPVEPQPTEFYDVTPTDKLKGDIKELQSRLKKALDDLGLQSVALKVNKNLQAYIDGKQVSISGKYFNSLIHVALGAPNPLKTLHHEAIHALKDLGFFSDAEWAVLEKAAEDKWIDKYNIKERYKGFSREVQIEEAIANAFPDFMQMGKVEKSIYQRVKDFFSRLRNVFRGMGYMTPDMAFNRTPEAVFQKVKENRLTGNKKIKNGAFMLDKSNGIASFLPERLNRVLNANTYTTNESTTKGYITYVSPMDFLKATTTSLEHENEIRKEAGSLNREQLKKESQEPYLEVEIKDGQLVIVGHEGRHRMAALDKEGIKKVPVVIVPSGGRIDNAKPIPSGAYFTKQYFGNSKEYGQSSFFNNDEILPLSYEYAKQVKEKYSNPEADVRFELSLEGVDPNVAKMAESTFGKQEPKTYVQTVKDLASKYRDRFKFMVADEYADIANVSWTGYMKSRLAKTIDTQMQVLLDYGHLEVRGGTLGYKKGTKGLKAIYAPLGNEVERFQIWLALNREANLPAEKRSFKEDLVKNRDQFIQGDLNGVPRRQLYETARKEQQELNKSVLEVAKKLNLIDQDAYETFAKDNFYIPFYKEMENGDVEGARIASKLTGQKFSHALKGGEKKVNDLMDNMLRNWSHILSASLKNDAALTTLKDAEKLGIATRVKDFQKSNPDVVKVMENGAPTYFKVEDQNLIDNIAQINYLGKQSALFKAMTQPSNWLRYGVTLNPAYKIRNIVKDSGTTVAVSDISPNIPGNLKKGWELTNKASDQYADALASGAIFQLGSSHDGKSADLIKKLIAEGTSDDTILNTPEKMMAGLKKAFKYYEDLGNRLENVNRMALYDKLIKEGKSPLEAAYEARDLLDFTSQGASRSLKVLSQLVPFMNTRVQGLYKLYRTGTDAQKQQRLAYTLGAIAIASMALYMIGMDDEDFKKRQDWDRDNFWWFKIGDTAFRIPKPYEIGGIGTLAERGLEQFMDDSVESKVFFSRMGQYVLDTLSLDPTPQAIKPMWNVLNNRDSFTDAPIETPGMERFTKTQRYSDKTSGVAKGLSEAINVPLSAVGLENTGPSPVQIDYLARGYFGWLGGLVGSTAARALEDKPSKPMLDAIGIAQTEPEVNSKYITDFYRSNAKIQTNFADMKRYAEQGNTEKVAEILKEKGNLIGLQKLYSQTINQMAEQRKYIQYISDKQDIPRDERQKMINVQKEIMSKMAENAESLRKSLDKK